MTIKVSSSSSSSFSRTLNKIKATTMDGWQPASAWSLHVGLIFLHNSHTLSSLCNLWGIITYSKNSDFFFLRDIIQKYYIPRSLPLCQVKNLPVNLCTFKQMWEDIVCMYTCICHSSVIFLTNSILFVFIGRFKVVACPRAIYSITGRATCAVEMLCA